MDLLEPLALTRHGASRGRFRSSHQTIKSACGATGPVGLGAESTDNVGPGDGTVVTKP